MAKVTLKTKGLEKAIKDIGKFRLEVLGDVVRELDRTALMVESNAKRNIRDNKSTDQGRLISSVVVHNTGQFKRTVGSNVGYAASVEFGRSPGSMPPVQPIREWAKRKGLPEGIAFAIALKIKREGIKPKPFLFPALEAERQRFIANLRKILNG